MTAFGVSTSGAGDCVSEGLCCTLQHLCIQRVLRRSEDDETCECVPVCVCSVILYNGVDSLLV